MSQVIITEHTYIFYCNGNFFMQWTFGSDDEAIKHAKQEEEERGMPVKVAKWLEFEA